jgi:hypothetical protein
MSINLDANDIVRMFQVRATAELKRELDEVKSWEDRVRRGLVRREHAEGYIQASKRIIRTKRHVLGFPEFLAEVGLNGEFDQLYRLPLIFWQIASFHSFQTVQHSGC